MPVTVGICSFKHEIHMKQLFTSLLLLTAILLTAFLPACEGMDDNYSTNPNLRLDFSRDTLTFDTVFTTIGTATRQFMIYNRNSEPLNIESVLLAGAGSSGFRINVDGRKGDSFSNIGIQGKDSLYVFVEVTVDPNGKNQPLLIEDSVLFFVNGIRQSVLLEAYGQDVTIYKGGAVFAQDTTLKAERPYLVYDSLVVAPGAKLSLAEGTTFYMHDKASVQVYGTIECLGTQEKPVLFRGDRLDWLLNNLPYDRMPGLWEGITFRPSSFDNRMDYTVVRNATGGLNFLASTTERQKISITNSQLSNMKGNLLSAVNCRINVANTELSNACGSVVGLVGGIYDFTHCTIVSYMTLAQVDSLTKVAVSLANYLGEEEKFPLEATFNNTIIDGGNSEELMKSDKDESVAFHYTFNHCMIKSRRGIDDTENFHDCQIAGWSPTYRSRGGSDNDYYLDFRLASDTTLCVGAADPEIARQYPVDRLGVNRLTAEKGPSIGAYEYMKPEEEK